MDSKYSLIDSGGGGINKRPTISPFNIKRKFTNGASSQSPQPQQHPSPVKKHKQNNFAINNNNYNNANNNGKNKNNQNCNRPPTLSIQEQRNLLPVFQVKRPLVQLILKQQTLILIGETGSGKTTQIPQFLYDFGLAKNGLIGITQPRRVAAITISKRVAQEQQCRLGELVGYTVRFEDVTSNQTKIKFMTDGSLLREALSDRLLKNYSVICLDEAHERTINTDVLFGIVKEAQRVRAEKHMIPLKIIIMSATMDVDHFSKYFNNCEPIYLAGRTYPVKVFHTKEPQTDYLQACLITLFDIHKKAPANHDVLIFLTGQEEIETLAKQIRLIAKSNEVNGPPIRVFALYSQLPQNKQLEVFLPISNGSRKVIICTNIAETSLTIKGIKYVIDSGMVKRKVYDSVTGMDMLKIVRISQDQSWQRTGRAGRESAGFCYRTYTMDDYRSMAMAATPEILRSNITATVLQLLALGINCKKFDFLDKPKNTDIDLAMKQLLSLGALKTVESTDLTPVGRKMSKFPLDPRFSKILLVSSELGCLEEMLSIVSVLSGESIFFNSFDNEKRADALTAHARFASEFGDHLTLLNVFRAFQEKNDKVNVWCHENFLNVRNLLYAKEVRQQLLDICNRLELTVSSCGENFDLIRKSLIAGLYNNIAEVQRDMQYMTLSSRQRVKIHPSSVLLNKTQSRCVLFTELVATSKNYMRTLTAIEADWIEEMAPANCGIINRLSNFN